MFMPRPRRGFTLIELLVVIAIIAILMALLLPAVQQAREAARRTQTRNHLKQIGIALHNYHERCGQFPSGWIGASNGRPDVLGSSGWGWAAMILPDLDQQPLFDQLDFHQSPAAPANAIARETALSVFRSPSDSSSDVWNLEEESNPGTVLASLPTANFIGNWGTTHLEDCESLAVGTACQGNGVFFHNSGVRFRDIRDGSSNTILIGQRKTDDTQSPAWHSTWVGVIAGGEEPFARILGVADHTPNHPAGHLDDFSSNHTGGVHFLFGDGRVRFVSENIDHRLYQSLATRAGNEPVGEF